MNLIVSAVLVLALQTSPAASAAGWTWTLYKGDGPLVLADEVPDTPQLRATLECEPGSGAVAISVYDTDAPSGFARIASGDATATSEARANRGKLETMLRADHPVFAAFLDNGRLTIAVGDQESRVTVAPRHRAKLRRFADHCAG